MAEVNDQWGGRYITAKEGAGPSYSGPIGHGQEFGVYSKGRGKTLSDMV